MVSPVSPENAKNAMQYKSQRLLIPRFVPPCALSAKEHSRSASPAACAGAIFSPNSAAPASVGISMEQLPIMVVGPMGPQPSAPVLVKKKPAIATPYTQPQSTVAPVGRRVTPPISGRSGTHTAQTMALNPAPQLWGSFLFMWSIVPFAEASAMVRPSSRYEFMLFTFRPHYTVRSEAKQFPAASKSSIIYQLFLFPSSPALRCPPPPARAARASAAEVPKASRRTAPERLWKSG